MNAQETDLSLMVVESLVIMPIPQTVNETNPGSVVSCEVHSEYSNAEHSLIFYDELFQRRGHYASWKINSITMKGQGYIHVPRERTLSLKRLVVSSGCFRK